MGCGCRKNKTEKTVKIVSSNKKLLKASILKSKKPSVKDKFCHTCQYLNKDNRGQEICGLTKRFISFIINNPLSKCPKNKF